MLSGHRPRARQACAAPWRFPLAALGAAWLCAALAAGTAQAQGQAPAEAEAEAAMFQALARDDASGLSTLFLRGADPNARDAKGQVGLFLAIQGGHARAVAQFLAHPDTRVDLANANGETPLMLAALKGQVAWVQQLLGRGAQVNREGWSPLHYAATGPSTEVIALLLARGAALDAPSPNGSTPLMMAAGYGSLDGARLLLQRGADARRRNGQGLDAADFARKAGREPLAQTLAQAAGAR